MTDKTEYGSIHLDTRIVQVLPLQPQPEIVLTTTNDAQPTPRTFADCCELCGADMVPYSTLAAANEKKRPFSDELAQKVIDGQVKEIDRLTKLVQAERTAREQAEQTVQVLDKAHKEACEAYERTVMRAGKAEQRLAAMEAVAWRRAVKHGWEYRSIEPTTKLIEREPGWIPLYVSPQATDEKDGELLKAAIAFQKYANTRYNDEPCSCVAINCSEQQRLWRAIDAARQPGSKGGKA